MKNKILIVVIFIVFVVVLWFVWNLVFDYKENEMTFIPDLVDKLEKSENIVVSSKDNSTKKTIVNRDEIREIISLISNSTNDGYTEVKDINLNYEIIFYDENNQEIASMYYDPKLQIYYNGKSMYLYNYDNVRLDELIK